jgi:phosphoribosylformylglycinamidine cyclo-ligase
VSVGETYRSAGVDLDALERLKERIGALSRVTYGPQVLGAPGGFAGLYRLEGYMDPVLVSSTDGVGTKLRIGALLGHYESLGIDLVNLNVNDVLTRGARPLFFLDYISTGQLDSQRMDALLRGMAWACREAGCSLVGGETALMPGVYVDDAFDLAGFVVGAVERDSMIDGAATREGDVLLGIPSSGVHTNGFSLVRKVFNTDEDSASLYRRYDGLNNALGEALLTTHRCYYPLLQPVLPLIKAMAHITGGGLFKNVPRVLPQGLAARFRMGTWEVHPIFRVIQREGKIEEEEMFRVFNMGLGMVVVCAPDNVAAIRDAVPESRVVGEVVPHGEGGRVILEAA